MLRTDSKTAAPLCILAAALFGCGGCSGEKVYEADASILIIRKSLNTEPKKSGEDYIATHLHFLRSPQIHERAIKKNDLGSLKSLPGNDPVAALSGGLTVRRDRNATNVLHLSFQGANPKECVAILTALIDAYKEFLDDTYRGSSNKTIGFITMKLGDIESKLEQTRSKHFRFLATHSPRPSLTRERATALEAKKAALLVSRAEITSRIGGLEKSLRGDADDQAAALSVAQAWAARNGFDKLPADVQKATTPAKAYAASLRQELEEIRAMDMALDASLVKLRDEMLHEKQDEIQEENLREDVRRTKNLYDTIIKRLEEINLVRDVGGFEAVVVKPPRETRTR